MNWDQIEHNWAAMTRRVRPERPATHTHDSAVSQPSGDMAEIVADGPEQAIMKVVAASRLIA